MVVTERVRSLVHRSGRTRDRSVLAILLAASALVAVMLVPVPVSAVADTPAPFAELDVLERTELYAALFQYRSEYATIGTRSMWDYSTEAYGVDDRADEFERDGRAGEVARTYERVSPSAGADDFLGFIPRARMSAAGAQMEQVNLYRSGSLRAVAFEKQGDYATLTESAKDDVIAEVEEICELYPPYHDNEWGDPLFPLTATDGDEWCAAFSDYEAHPPVNGGDPEIGFIFTEPVEGLGLVPLYWHVKYEIVRRTGFLRSSYRVPSVDVRIGRSGDFATIHETVDVGNFTTVEAHADPVDDAAHLLGYVFPAIPGFVQSPTLVDTSGAVKAPNRASLIIDQEYTNDTSQTQSLEFEATYEEVTTLSVSSTRSSSHLQGFEYGVKVGVEAGVEAGGFSATVTTEISASTKTEDVYSLSATRESGELSSVGRTYTVPVMVPPQTRIELRAAIYDDIVGTQTYRGTIATYWRHSDDERVWATMDSDLQPWVVEFDIQASQAARIEVWVEEFSTEPGTVRDATTIAEIRSASDYSSSDADSLRLYRAFLNREPDVSGAIYWITRSRVGSNLDDLAWGFAQSAEFKAKYGVLDNAQFLNLVYRNMLDREPDQGGFDYWLAKMESGELSQHTVVRWVVANAEFIGRYPYGPLG